MIVAILITAVALFFILFGRMSTYLLLGILACFIVLASIVVGKGKKEHGGFLSIDYLAQQSKLNRWQAGTKMSFSILFAFFAILAKPIIVPIAIFIGMIFLTLVIGDTKPSYYFSLLTTPITFITLSILAIVLELSSSPIGIINIPIGAKFLVVTAQSQTAAITSMIRAISAVSCLYFLSLTTPMSKVINVLRIIKVPSVVINLMYLMYRYIFILLETFHNMRHAAASRLGYCDRKTALKTTVLTSANLFFISLRKSADNYTAIESRCFDDTIQFLVKPVKVQFKEIFIMSTFLIIVLAVWIFGGIYA